MHCAKTLTLVLGLMLVGACTVPVGADGGASEADADDAAPAAVSGEKEARAAAGDWVFRYDEAQEEVTARRGPSTMIYRFKEMGDEGALLIKAFRGYDGATWSIPPMSSPSEAAAAPPLQPEYVIVGPPPRVSTPSYTTPGLTAGGGYSHGRHGPPPGVDSRTWNRMCQIAAAIATSFTCSTILVSCAAGTYITIGGLAIPCSLIGAMACGASAGAGVSLAMDCPK